MTVFQSTSADFCFPLPRLLALPTEAWRGAEIHRRSAENGYINLPGPEKKTVAYLLGGSVMKVKFNTDTWGMCYKTFYCRYCSRNVIS